MQHTEPHPHPLVSVVIPCYRQAHLIGDAVASVCAQTYPNVEVIVVDDGSPAEDDPAPVVARFSGVRLVRQENGGLSSARNAGWRVCRGEYVVFLDGDDLLLPEAVATGVRVFADHAECAFVHGLSERRTLDGRLLGVRPPLVGAFDHFEALLKRNFVRGIHAVMFRRSAVEAAGGYDERQRFAEDWDLYLRLAHRFPAYGHGELVAIYRRHDHNVNSARNAARMLVYSLMVLDKQRASVGRDPRLRAALREGRRWVRSLFGERLAERVGAHVRAGEWRAAWDEGWVLLRHDPRRALGRARRAVARRSPAPAPAHSVRPTDTP